LIFEEVQEICKSLSVGQNEELALFLKPKCTIEKIFSDKKKEYDEIFCR
jgi:hypothetical protein